MNTIALPNLDLDFSSSRTSLVERLCAKLAPQEEQAEHCSDGSIKDYSHIYSYPEFDARWWTDEAYTRRCREIQMELYWLLRSEIRCLQRVSSNQLTENQRDWFTCAWTILIGIETMGWKLSVACSREICQLAQLAFKLLELDLASETTHQKIGSLLAYASAGGAKPEARVS